MPILSPAALSVRQGDPDRFFTILFAPEPRRESLFAFYAFNLELASIARRVSEPLLRRIRLQWWREEVSRCLKKGDSEFPPILQALGRAYHLCPALTYQNIEALIDAYDTALATREEAIVGSHHRIGMALGNLIATILDGNDAERTAMGLITSAWEDLSALRHGIYGTTPEIIITHLGRFRRSLNEARTWCARPRRNVMAGFLPVVPLEGWLDRIQSCDGQLRHPKMALPGGRPMAVLLCAWRRRY